MCGAVHNECKLGKVEMDSSDVLMLIIDLIECSLKIIMQKLSHMDSWIYYICSYRPLEYGLHRGLVWYLIFHHCKFEHLIQGKYLMGSIEYN